MLNLDDLLLCGSTELFTVIVSMIVNVQCESLSYKQPEHIRRQDEWTMISICLMYCSNKRVN